MMFYYWAAAIALVLLYLLYLELVKPTPQVGTVDGSVTYGDATMVGGVTVTLVNSSEQTVMSATTDEAGAFAFGEVAIGSYRVHAHKDVDEGFLEGEVYVEILGGDEVAVDLPLVS